MVVSVEIAAQHAVADALPAPPRIGEFLVCLFVRPDRQVDRLADFAGLYRILWLPKFAAPCRRTLRRPCAVVRGRRREDHDCWSDRGHHLPHFQAVAQFPLDDGAHRINPGNQNLPPNGQSAEGTKPAWMALFEELVRSGTLNVGTANCNGVIWCPPTGTIVLSGSPLPSAVTIHAPPKAVTIYAHSKEVTDTHYAPRVARWMYVWQALRSVVAIKATALIVLIDWLMRHLGW